MQRIRRNWVIMTILILFTILFHGKEVHANENIYEKRLALYKKTEAVTSFPWYYLAAIDQYERSMKTNVPKDEIVSITFPKEQWYGISNPSRTKDARIIELFNGIGKDGNGDGIADPNNEEDILHSAALLFREYGMTEDDFKISLWRYYERDLTVKTIMNTARIYKQYNTNELLNRHFPVSISHNYSYRSTWGHSRGFGGRRIHEGTDIFANYGTPVISTTYGVIELKGWNLYGGWRIGIRDIHNIYHYYAHLNAYSDDVEVGDIVEPGDVLGTVGSSGYGPPGTAGKFPPHLHYGMYKDNGRNEWSFDPYPYLRRWEQMTREQ